MFLGTLETSRTSEHSLVLACGTLLDGWRLGLPQITICYKLTTNDIKVVIMSVLARVNEKNHNLK